MGCGNNGTATEDDIEKLVGTWEYDGGTHLVFYSDGTFNQYSDDDDFDVHYGTWSAEIVDGFIQLTERCEPCRLASIERIAEDRDRHDNHMRVVFDLSDFGVDTLDMDTLFHKESKEIRDWDGGRPENAYTQGRLSGNDDTIVGAFFDIDKLEKKISEILDMQETQGEIEAFQIHEWVDDENTRSFDPQLIPFSIEPFEEDDFWELDEDMAGVMVTYLRIEDSTIYGFYSLEDAQINDTDGGDFWTVTRVE